MCCGYLFKILASFAMAALGSDGPSFARENREENLKKLARLWDSRGLLAMFPEGHYSGLACRVFNAHKNAEIDRQIGDRRWFNAAECHPRGPSAYLPAQNLITSLHCPPGYKLVGCAADRKDFYHQAKVTRQRAHTNVLPFTYKRGEACSLHAWVEILEAGAGKVTRETHGDRYGMAPAKTLKENQIHEVAFGFKSLFQGDHLGVEFALESHTALLRDGGLLSSDETILGHHVFPRGPLWQGLVIDDYFVISREKENAKSSSAKSVQHLERAEQIYKDAGVFGSDDKTIRGAESFKVIGAEVLADSKTRSAGIVSVAAPLSKRVPMMMLSLRTAALPFSRTLASRLAGNWICVLMYRRCLCCLLSDLFNYGTRLLKNSSWLASLGFALPLTFQSPMMTTSMRPMPPTQKEPSPPRRLGLSFLRFFGLVATRREPTQCWTHRPGQL